MLGKIILALGILGVVVGGGVFLVSMLLPVVTEGRTSWEEALLGIIPGAVVLVFSFLLAVVGLILVLKKRRTA